MCRSYPISLCYILNTRVIRDTRPPNRELGSQPNRLLNTSFQNFGVKQLQRQHCYQNECSPEWVRKSSTTLGLSVFHDTTDQIRLLEPTELEELLTNSLYS